MPGATNLSDCEPLRESILQYNAAGKWLAAICAAPLVYGRLGLLNGKNATCYPGFEHELKGANCLKKTVVCDKNFITGCGPGAAFALGHAIVTALISKEKADTILQQMMFQVYD
jgi:4-methyl-5(b-hydroxyethyl)-thiazole monophosphate biosynthesis